MHRNAENAATASVAAHMQGKFWKYHDLLFKNQGGLDETSLENYASQAGLDLARFRTDYKNPALRKRVQSEGDVAEKLGARGTPAFFINGKRQVGWGSWNGFRSLVQRELNQVEELMKAGTPLAKIHALRAKEHLSAEEFSVYKVAVIDQLAGK